MINKGIDMFNYNDYIYFVSKPTIDVSNNRLITYFDDDNYVIYERAIKEYTNSKEKGLFLKKEYLNRKEPSLWINNNTTDLSDFWRVHEKISKLVEKERLRIKN